MGACLFCIVIGSCVTGVRSLGVSIYFLSFVSFSFVALLNISPTSFYAFIIV